MSAAVFEQRRALYKGKCEGAVKLKEANCINGSDEAMETNFSMNFWPL